MSPTHLATARAGYASGGFSLLFFADAVDELRDLVLLVGEEMGVGLQYDLFGVAYPSRDGAVAHPLGQKVGDAGVAEPMRFHVGEARLLRGICRRAA